MGGAVEAFAKDRADVRLLALAIVEGNPPDVRKRCRVTSGRVAAIAFHKGNSSVELDKQACRKTGATSSSSGSFPPDRQW